MIGASFCTGIGAPEIAAPWIDWRLAAEIAAFPRDVIRARFGHVPAEELRPGSGGRVLWRDFTALRVRHYRRLGLPCPQILAAGTPCQAFSFAGKRRGLADARGNITLEFVRHVQSLAPGLPLFDAPASGGSNGFCGKMFPESSPTKRTPSAVSWRDYVEGIPPLLRLKAADGLTWVLLQDRLRAPRGGFSTLNTSDSPSGGAGCGLWSVLDHPIPPKYSLSARACSGILRRAEGRGKELPAILALALRAVAHWGRNPAPAAPGDEAAAAALGAGALATNAEGAEGFTFTASNLAKTVNNQSPLAVVAFDPAQVTSPDNRSNPQPGAAGHTLAAGAPAPLIVSFALRGREGGAQAEAEPGGIAPALRSAPGGSTLPFVAGAAREETAAPLLFFVRRLTPRECERLQGFPDDHTAIVRAGGPAADSPRYAALGNSQAVPNVAWILDRIGASDRRRAEA